jgi:putative ABC transport system permease protein
MVSIEGTVLAATGILFGTLASLVTVLPYNVARTDTIIPNATIGIYLAIVALATTLTLAASLSTARRTLRTPAVEAAAA